MPTIYLSDQQLAECEQAALDREADSRKRGYQNRRGYNERFNLEMQTRSFAAEVAVSRYLKVSPLQTGVGGVGKPDIVLEDGTEIAVKSSDRAFSLLVPPAQLKDWQFFALVKVNGDSAEILGFARGSTIRSNARLTTLGLDRDPVYSLPLGFLSPSIDTCPF